MTIFKCYAQFYLSFYYSLKKSNKMSEFEGLKITVGEATPNFLVHPYCQVVCKNKGELLYILEWAKQAGKTVSTSFYEFEKFPIHFFLADDIVGWTDLTDRIGEKVPFSLFCHFVNWA